MDNRRPIFQRKLTRYDGSILEKAFCQKIFATRDIKEVDEFLVTYFMMVTNLHYYFRESEQFRIEFAVRIEGKFKHNLYNKYFSNQLESDDEVDTLQQRIEWWMVVVDKLGVIPNDVYDYTFDELYVLYRKAIDPEMQYLVKALRDGQIIP